jgi:hypothetical protein
MYPEAKYIYLFPNSLIIYHFMKSDISEKSID